jgi:sporulation protein YlmC with PRC-barrel domain
MKLEIMTVTAFAMAMAGAASASAQTERKQNQDQHQQQAAEPKRSEAQPKAAQQCLKDLATFEKQAQQDGYWITGWGSRWNDARPPAATTAAPGAAAGATLAYPWGPRTPYGMYSPRYQVRTLHAAASVLGHRGDQEACSKVVSELQEIYGRHVQDLREAGIKPGDVQSWRQERIVAARPVGQLDVPLSVDEVTGTEIRNAKDQWLGTIDDVVLDPKSRQISFVVVERGGFLGMGEDHVVVPWKALSATRNLNAFVLNVDEQVMKAAPKVDADRVGDLSVFQQHRQQAEQYWQKHIQG